MTLRTLSTKDFRRYFAYLDSLANFREINYSVFDRYFCTAGCKICYVKEEMSIAQENYKISTRIEEEINELSKITDIITFCDDLFYLNKHHKDVYNIIKENSRKLVFGGMTDNQWLKVSPLLLDFDFKYIYESSFSDTFFVKHQKQLEKYFKILLTKYKFEQIKIISTDEKATDICMDFFIENGIKLHVQKKIEFKDDNIPILNDNILNNSLFYTHGKFYFSLLDNINDTNSIGTINDIDELIYNVIRKKLTYYSNTAQELLKLNSSLTDLSGIEYTINIANNLILNKNFNIIPLVSFDSSKKLSSFLEDKNWIKTEYGLLDFKKYKESNEFIFLYDWK